MPCSPIVLVCSSYLRRPHEPNDAFVTRSQAFFEVRGPIICFSFIFVFCNNSIMIVACAWNRSLRAVLLQFFIMSSVDFCLQSTRLKIRKSRDIYFLVKHFATRFSCFAETCYEKFLCSSFMLPKTTSAAARCGKIDRVVHKSFQYIVFLRWERSKCLIYNIRHLVSRYNLLLIFG